MSRDSARMVALALLAKMCPRWQTVGVASLLILSVTSVAAQVLEYKGVPFGSSLSKFKAAHPSFQCDEPRDNVQGCFVSKKICQSLGRKCNAAEMEELRYADESVDPIFATFLNGKLEFVVVTFPTGSYEAIRDALLAKYGAASDVEQEPYKTLGGMTSTNERLIWLRSGHVILIKRHGTNIAEGNLSLQSDTFRASSKSSGDSQAKKRQSNM